MPSKALARISKLSCFAYSRNILGKQKTDIIRPSKNHLRSRGNKWLYRTAGILTGQLCCTNTSREGCLLSENISVRFYYGRLNIFFLTASEGGVPLPPQRLNLSEPRIPHDNGSYFFASCSCLMSFFTTQLYHVVSEECKIFVNLLWFISCQAEYRKKYLIARKQAAITTHSL